MPWYLQTTGTPTAVNAAAAALTTVDDGNGQNAQLARAVADIASEITALAANQQLEVRARGSYGLNHSSIHIDVYVIPGTLGGQIESPPFKPGPPHYS
jgi:hypothetical protein